MLPERGEGCRCKGKTPKTLCYVMLNERQRLIRNNQENAET